MCVNTPFPFVQIGIHTNRHTYTSPAINTGGNQFQAVEYQYLFLTKHIPEGKRYHPGRERPTYTLIIPAILKSTGASQTQTEYVFCELNTSLIIPSKSFNIQVYLTL